MELKDWVLPEFVNGEYNDVPAMRLLYAKVVSTYSLHERAWDFTSHKNVVAWCVVFHKNRYYAVGWNENPATGWSFPIKWLRNEHASWAQQLQMSK